MLFLVVIYISYVCLSYLMIAFINLLKKHIISTRLFILLPSLPFKYFFIDLPCYIYNVYSMNNEILYHQDRLGSLLLVLLLNKPQNFEY